MASLFLIRHGEPVITGVLLGQMDPPLSPNARSLLGRSLQELDVQVVWTSPLQRARQTAALIPCRRVQELSGLQEIDQGQWTGKSWPEVEAQWSELAALKVSDWFGTAAPGGETWTCFLDRVRGAWDTVRRGPSPAAIVAHQGVNAALLQLLQNRDPLGFSQSYGEVLRIEYD